MKLSGSRFENALWKKICWIILAEFIPGQTQKIGAEYPQIFGKAEMPRQAAGGFRWETRWGPNDFRKAWPVIFQNIWGRAKSQKFAKDGLVCGLHLNNLWEPKWNEVT